MQIQCPCCKKEFSLFESQVKKKECKIRCIGCGHIMKITPGKMKVNNSTRFNRL
ncbi:zinc-ribbon domain-containing protein [Dendrosporobacter sp. 1207_IL3150]|uniref:zinc-ribbon domain-containing protein n=1 Tax=Dendrosporobacter sp. 1207_IL3150 TaxID=3084054 RepID=UPI002FD91469